MRAPGRRDRPLLDLARTLRAGACLLILHVLLGLPAHAGAVGAVQDPASIRAVAEALAARTVATYPGSARYRVSDPDPRLRLPVCTSMEAFVPPGSRAVGRTNIGVRCLAPKSWQVFLTAEIRVDVPFLVTARPVTAGQTLDAGDVAVRHADLASLAPGTLDDPAQLAGKTVRTALPAGQALREEMLRAATVVHQGSQVVVYSAGSGFRVSTSGRAVNDAAAGESVQVKLENGQVVRGVARGSGEIEVPR